MLLLAAVLVATTTAVHLPGKPYYDLNHADILFEQFLREYGKVYNPEEYLTRLDIFKENLKEINERNARHPQIEFGVTRFTDLNAEERRRYLGFERSDDEIERLVTKLEYPAEALTAPDHFDWRELNAVTPIKDQGECGSCYIFSATGVIEGQYAIKYHKLIALSEQHGLDCTTPAIYDDTCSGGYLERVLIYYEYHPQPPFNSLHAQFGIIREKDYPYTAKRSDCKEKTLIIKNNIAPVTNVTRTQIYNMDEESLKQLLYQTGPVGVGMDFQDFWHYKSGIAQPIKCPPSPLINHDVLLIGYGIENGTKYWIIKNSFGTKWGEDGYMRLVRGVRACGISRYVATCTIP